MTATHAELNRYFEMINRRVPISVSQSIRWLRKPSSFAVRLVVALLLILGGIFSFFTCLGPLDAASRPAFHRAGCAHIAKAPRQRVGVG